MEEVKKAVRKMKTGKASGCSGLTIDMIKSLDEMGDEMVFSLLKTIWKEGSILTEWGKTAKRFQFTNKKETHWTARATGESSY